MSIEKKIRKKMGHQKNVTETDIKAAIQDAQRQGLQSTFLRTTRDKWHQMHTD